MDQAIDTSSCDREPIHIPGSIQPHGIMLVADKTTLLVRHGAGDVERVFAVELWADRPLADFLGEEVAQKAALVSATAAKRAFIDSIEAPGAALLDVTAHIIDNWLIVEIEPKVDRSAIVARTARQDRGCFKRLRPGDHAEKPLRYRRRSVSRTHAIRPRDGVPLPGERRGRGHRRSKTRRPELVPQSSFSGLGYSAAGPRALHPQPASRHSGRELPTRPVAAAVGWPCPTGYERQHSSQRLADPSAVPEKHGGGGFSVGFHREGRHPLGTDRMPQRNAADDRLRYPRDMPHACQQSRPPDQDAGRSRRLSRAAAAARLAGRYDRIAVAAWIARRGDCRACRRSVPADPLRRLCSPARQGALADRRLSAGAGCQNAGGMADNQERRVGVFDQPADRIVSGSGAIPGNCRRRPHRAAICRGTLVADLVPRRRSPGREVGGQSAQSGRT